MAGEPAFFELGVQDVERARAFYGALFGWAFERGPSGDGYVIGTPGMPGGLHGGDPGASPYLFFRVEDIDAAAARVGELGGTAEPIPGEEGVLETAVGRFLLCRDDQGSSFGLFEAPRTDG